MHRKIIRPLVAALLLGFWLHFPGDAREEGGRYRSPLQKHNGYSSSFQEFRSDHFHGGIDFRTFSKTGFPVHAISDGAVYRIRMVKRGSGRGVYLRHADGNTSLYFHLERFSPELESILKKRQQRMGKKYVGNVDLVPAVHVVSGQIIGYSGETGAGFPHLHLEIRDPRGVKLNPFSLVDTGIEDRNAPVIQALILRSRGAGLVNGKPGELVLPMSRINGVFTPGADVVVTGGFDVVVGARDISDSGRFVAPASIRGRLDGSPVFAVEFQRFAWEDNNQLGFVYDMRESRSSRFFYNLFPQPGNELEQTKVPLRGLLEALPEGSHTLTVDVADHFSNRASGRLRLIRRSLPRIRTGSVFRRGGNVLIEVVDSGGAASDPVEALLMDAEGKRVSGKMVAGGLKAPGILELEEPRPAVVLELRFHVNGIAYAAQRFSVASLPLPGITGITVDPYLDGDRAVLRIGNFPRGAEALRLRLAAAGDAWQFPLTSLEGLYFILSGDTLPDCGEEHRVPLQFGIMDNQRLAALLQQTLVLLRLEPGKTAVMRHGTFFARFASRSVREPRLMSLATADHPSPFPVLSEQIRLFPDHFAFLDRVDYGFRIRVANPRQASIFKWDDLKQRWNPVKTEVHVGKHEFTTRVRASGTFALLRDTAPPAIDFQFRGIARLPRIVITDQGTGVDDESVEVFLDGILLDTEYDPDRRHVDLESPPVLSAGTHILEVRCRDRARNSRNRRRSVKIGSAAGKKG